jgi:hypothetical protein
MYVGRYASGWKQVIGAVGGVVRVRIVWVEKTPGVLIFHLGTNPEIGGAASSDLE